MRSTPNPLVVAVAGIVVAIAVAAGCSTPGAGGAATSKGERFFQTKCNACHPGGGQGAGPPIDVSIAAGFLERGKATGRHAVPESYWEPLMGYLQQLGGGAPDTAVAAAPAPGAPVAAAPIAAAAPVAVAAAPVISGDVGAGNSYFQNKCAKCHAGGKRIPGKAIPGPLVSGGSGKHGIAADQFNNVLAYLVTLGAVPTGAPVAAAPVAIAPAPVAAAPVAAPAASSASSGDAAAGGGFFQTKCAKCHPGGNKIVGKAVPGVLVNGGSGKHGVPGEHFDNLLAYLTTIGAVRAGAAPVAAAPTGVPQTSTSTTTTQPRTTTPAPANGIIPMNAGMVNCSCSCQCPANAPPEALPAACLCQCQCPR